jgi:hypothetical protein
VLRQLALEETTFGRAVEMIVKVLRRLPGGGVPVSYYPGSVNRTSAAR